MFWINTIRLFKSVNTTKLYLIVILILFYTFLFCFIPDNEFGVRGREEYLLRTLTKSNNGLDNGRSSILDKTTSEYIDPLHNDADNIFKRIYLQLHHDGVLQHKSNLVYIVNRLYYSIVSATTVGYGDNFPISIRCKLLTISYLLLFLVITLT